MLASQRKDLPAVSMSILALDQRPVLKAEAERAFVL